MQRIDISGNSRLMGQLPEFPINNSLEVLPLRYTNFSGSIPASIANLSNLQLEASRPIQHELVNWKPQQKSYFSPVRDSTTKLMQPY
ncbi:hypothetical protein Golob_004190 [Gossypium lobatum]|uniref:Uncharacterized protein n=1 Tax=Gossypium lobatum TaxID=34289 RepID=A0A7J8N0P7_9ROSI|nr:hypothetical protein [Gossypium lobatum]